MAFACLLVPAQRGFGDPRAQLGGERAVVVGVGAEGGVVA